YDFEAVTLASEQIVGNENAAVQFLLVSFWEITVAGGGTANLDLTRLCPWINQFKIDIFHRPADEAVDFIRCLAVVTNSATLRCTVKRMNGQSEFCLKLFRDREWQRRAGGDAKPELRRRGHIFHFAKRLTKHRQPWNHSPLR